jgi:hypothetical protein
MFGAMNIRFTSPISPKSVWRATASDAPFSALGLQSVRATAGLFCAADHFARR